MLYNIDELSVDSLVDLIKRCAQKYYSGEPIITDSEFDSLVDKLKELDPNNEILKLTGWGYDPNLVSFGIKKNHVYGKVTGIENKPRKLENIPLNLRASNVKTRISAKLDGLSCVMYYKDGDFKLALTRGDGIVGIDVTNKVRYILRNDLRYKHIEGFSGAIRGEFVISMDNWKMIPASEDPSKNPRNYASGIINRHEICDELKYVDLVVYKIIAWESCNEYLDVRIMTEKLANHFEHIVDHCIVLNAEKIDETLLTDLFNTYNQHYPCDGCVITSNNVKILNPDLVFNEVAFKFESERAEATIDHIEWNLTRTGMLKPVACINPVNLAGTTVSRCTCFNAKFVSDNVLGRGAIIEIEKSGEIIPDIQRVVKHAEYVDIPVVCPKCSRPLTMVGTDLRCLNEDCDGASMADLHHWTNVIADVDGLGGKIKDSFFEEYDIHSVTELYDKIRSIKLGDSATDKKLIEMINKLTCDKVDANRALVALNIPRLGWKSAEKIVNANMFKEFADSPDIFRTEMFDELCCKLDAIVGPATRKSIECNMLKINRLEYLKGRVMVKLNNSEDSNQESKGDVCITGKLSIKRSEFENIIRSAGYNPVGKVNKNTVYLITDNPEGTSSKNKTATELGIKKITEQEFMSLIKGE